MATPNDDAPPSAGARTIACWAVALVLVAICLLPMILLPLARDQAHFAYAGQVILDGGLPYKDVIDAKGPVIHYAYALAMGLFGQTEAGVRLFFYLVAIVGAVLAGVLGHRLAGRWAIIPCGLCFGLAALQGNPDCNWSSAETEDLILVLTLGAVVLMAAPGGPGWHGWLVQPCSLGATRLGKQAVAPTWRMFLAGVLLGTACMVKPTAVAACVTLAAVMVWELIRVEKVGAAASAGKLLAAVAGVVLPVAAFLAYFAARGGLRDLWDVVVTYNRNYAGIRLTRDAFDYVKVFGLPWRGLSILAIWAALAGMPGHRVTWRMLWAALLGGWLAVAWQGKYTHYHWTPMVGCMAVLAGCQCARLCEPIRQRFAKPAVRALAMLGAIVLIPLIAAPTNVYYLNRIYRSAAEVLVGRKTVAEFRAPFTSGSASADVTRRVAEYIRARTRPGDTVMVWGYEVIINFLADRRAPSRFMMDHPLSSLSGPFQGPWRKEFMRDVKREQPIYILVVTGDAPSTPFEQKDSDVALDEFPEFHAYLLANYVEETSIETFRICRRRQKDAERSQ